MDIRLFSGLAFALAVLIGGLSCGGDDDDNAPNVDDDDNDNNDDGGDDDDDNDNNDESPADDDDDNDDDNNDESPADDDDDNNDDDDNDDDDNDDTTPLVPLGVYTVAGTDTHGDYAGYVEVREGDDLPSVTRLVQYPDLGFPDPYVYLAYQVHTAWTSQLDGAQFDVSLQVADFMTNYNGVTRTEADGDPVVIHAAVAPAAKDGFAVTYASDPEATREYAAAETWTYDGPNGPDPLFVNDDLTTATHEPMPSWLKTIVDAVFAEYHQLPLFDDYRDRPEFIAGIHFYNHFHTDFAWYRAHPAAIRVVNKWLDQVSMAETMLRARAFAPTFAEKATLYDAEMPAYYLNPVGFYSAAQLSVEKLPQSESGDGLLWSGCYLASQAFRWLTTGEPEALENWLFVLDGEILAHDIPQDVTTFARAVRPHVDDGAKDWVQGAPPYEAYDWLTGGNNDMIQGLYYAYTISYIFLPDDPAYDSYRTAIAERAARLADYADVARDDGFNEMKANLLAYLSAGEQRFLDRYNELWSNPAYKLWTRMGNGMFYLWGISDWSGQHLDTVGSIIMQLLVQETGADGAAEIEVGWSAGMRMNATSGQVLWPVAAKAFADPWPSLDYVFDDAIWGMREMPYPKQNFDLDQRIDPKWCASPIPSLFWKFDWMSGGRFQGLYGVPNFERDASETYFNGAPFAVSSGASDWFHGAGADFLHAYWLGRYYGVIDEGD